MSVYQTHKGKVKRKTELTLKIDLIGYKKNKTVYKNVPVAVIELRRELLKFPRLTYCSPIYYYMDIFVKFQLGFTSPSPQCNILLMSY